MARKNKEPKGRKYRTASAFDLRKPTGRFSLWQERIARSTEKLNIEKRKKTRDEALKYVDGSYGRNASGEKVYLNEAQPALEDLVYGTIPKMPPVKCEARRLDQEPIADMCSSLIDETLSSNVIRVLEALIATEWDEIGWGIGITKTGWVAEDIDSLYKPTGSSAYLRPHVARAHEESSDWGGAEISTDDDDIVHIQTHTEDMPFSEDPQYATAQGHIQAHWARVGYKQWSHPTATRVDPYRFRYDPDAEVWEDQTWRAEAVDMLVYELQKIPGTKNLNPENCPLSDEFDNHKTTWDDTASSVFDYENSKVRVWLIHDRRNKNYLIIPYDDGSGRKPLLETDWPYGSIEVYHKIVHRPIPGQVHGTVTLQLILPVLDELCRTNASIRRHVRRSANAKMFGPRGMLDTKANRDLEDQTKPYVEVPGGAAQLREFNPPALPKELPIFRETLLAELRRLLGTDIMSQGGDTPHQISASEAQLRGSYQGARFSQRQSEMSDLIGDLSRAIIMLFRDFADEAQTVRVMGPLGVEMRQLSPSEIPEDLMIRLDISSVSEDAQAQNTQNLIAAQQMMAVNLQGMYNPISLTMDIMESMGIRNPQKYLTPPEEINPVPEGQTQQVGASGTEAGAQSGAPNQPQLQIAG